MKKYFLVFLILFSAFYNINSNKFFHDKNDTNQHDKYAQEHIFHSSTNKFFQDKDDTNQHDKYAQEHIFHSSTIETLLFDEWRVSQVYTILPSAFGFNRFESFEMYDNMFDNPLFREIIEPYNEKLLSQTIVFSEYNIVINDIEILQSPEYMLQRRTGGIYGDNIWARYRPFNDYFEFNSDIYYYFKVINYEDYELDTFSILPRGFIVSHDYIVCPVPDDWIFYVLERHSE